MIKINIDLTSISSTTDPVDHFKLWVEKLEKDFEARENITPSNYAPKRGDDLYFDTLTDLVDDLSVDTF